MREIKFRQRNKNMPTILISGMVFISYQGWYDDNTYTTGWTTVNYEKPISTGDELEEIVKILHGYYPKMKKIIILNWKRLESKNIVGDADIYNKKYAHQKGVSGFSRWMEPFSKVDMFGKPTVFSDKFMEE